MNGLLDCCIFTQILWLIGFQYVLKNELCLHRTQLRHNFSADYRFMGPDLGSNELEKSSQIFTQTV